MSPWGEFILTIILYKQTLVQLRGGGITNPYLIYFWMGLKRIRFYRFIKVLEENYRLLDLLSEAV